MIHIDDLNITDMGEGGASPVTEHVEGAERRPDTRNDQALPNLVDVFGYFEESETNTWGLLRQVSSPYLSLDASPASPRNLISCHFTHRC